jgi:restriction endonuclease S subunit
MISYILPSNQVRDGIYIPKYYNPRIKHFLESLVDDFELVPFSQLVKEKRISIRSGKEIGKMAYGTGDIPFIRTSDINNWEVRSMPKQGVSEEIFNEYNAGIGLQVGDILLVKDGTYLIGTNCLLTRNDTKCLYQSHVLRIRSLDHESLPSELLFAGLNSAIVQAQIRSVQFSADIIDTIGNRLLEVVLPIPRKKSIRVGITEKFVELIRQRDVGRLFIKNSAQIVEECLVEGSSEPLEEFLHSADSEDFEDRDFDTISKEFGGFESFVISSSTIRESIFIPKYYSTSMQEELSRLRKNCVLKSFKELKGEKKLQYNTGVEIGKMAYGTGDIPFIRTSDLSNWETKHDPKQGISEEIFEMNQKKSPIGPYDILMVRDGSYLIGSNALIFPEEAQMLYCGGIYRISLSQEGDLTPWLLMALMNSYVVKRQIRSKQFTRDVIDTLGNRFEEVVLPIPHKELSNRLSAQVEAVLLNRAGAKARIKQLITEYHPPMDV